MVTAEVTARKLQARDLFTLAKIIHNAKGDIQEVIREQSQQPRSVQLHGLGEEPEGVPESSGGLEIDVNRMGIAVIFSLLGQADQAIKPWLADMAQMKPKEFDELELGQVVSLIEQVVGQEDWAGFLERLSGILSRSMTAST